jgi:hypothetical protein
VETLHTVARKVHLISTSEFSADATVLERAACLTNLENDIIYKVVRFIGDNLKLSGGQERR